MNVEILDVDSQVWADTLQTLPHDVYHLAQYAAIEATRIQAKPQAILVQSADNLFFLPYLVRDCHDVFPESLQSGEIYDAVSPYGYPGLLFSESASSDSAFIEHAMRAAQDAFVQQNICSLFVRNHPILGQPYPSLIQENYLTFGGETVSIDLTLPTEKLWSHTRRGHQSTINKCKRLGYSIEFVNPQTYIDEFKSIYYETMSRVEASSRYFFSDDYFADLLTLSDHLHLAIAKLDDQIAAASLFFEANGLVQAHLGGTRTVFLQDSPFSLVLDQTRYWAKSRGNKTLHIGGGVGASEDALYRFKSGFSKQRHQFWIMKWITDAERYQYLVKLKEEQISSKLETDYFPAYRGV
jgi:hypothetical protein